MGQAGRDTLAHPREAVVITPRPPPPSPPTTLFVLPVSLGDEDDLSLEVPEDRASEAAELAREFVAQHNLGSQWPEAEGQIAAAITAEVQRLRRER